MKQPSLTLAQWRALIHVVDAGGYAQAAEQLFKSQSAISYAVQQIEQQLGVKVFERVGRRAVLTATGQLLYRRGQRLLEEAAKLEAAAQRLSAGWEAELHLAVEMLFPTELLLSALAALAETSPHTRVDVVESVLGGTPEALLERRVDLAISPRIPPGFLGDALMTVRLIAVAHPEHALHQLHRPLLLDDLHAARHIVVRDSGARRDDRAVTQDIEQRWTVSHIETSIEAVCRGHGFAWLPHTRIAQALADGRLKPLPLTEGGERAVALYLILAEPELAGPAALQLKHCLQQAVAQASG